ncbi:formate dehydrogenase subunit gamma [Belnapia sp. T18]|uniref:Formate dehydrogenase subunit gamma n=1 Tax=Belnapia arida TaxID=2804533 RepID=A0ABS1UFB4_9PROT|nr:formate dehydrogenase subunit gamma [Belnapia arida]MBL6081956.1 formate dehydrogenase subunit gamma [Belnapia arida]
MMRFVMALALLLPLGGAMAQQDSGAPAGGAPSVQSVAPEVGSGRGGANNAQQPSSTAPETQTGGPRPAPIAPRPRVAVEPIVAPPPFTARSDTDATALEAQRAEQGGVIEGAVSIPNQAAGILVQPAGRDWRGFRTRILTIAGAVILLGTVFILAGLYFLRGPQRIDAGRSGRTLHRYGLFERMNHWMVAVSFVLLGLTGINITFGRTLLRPVIGAEAFTTLTWTGQAVHQFLSFPFVIGLMAMVLVWARDNLPSRVDIAWIKAGGPAAKGHPPAGRFNAAQKALYWFVIGGGVLAAVSGYLLMAPGLLDNVTNQQWAHVLHGLMAMVMMAAIIGHIYIGTIGTEGAFEAMATGRVDYNYAREHHSLWVEERVAEARRLAAGAD